MAAVPAVLICTGGPIRRIHVGNREWRFEMHPYCGPAVVGKYDQILDVQPGPRSPFWKAVTLWAQQGKCIDADGLCLWEPPKPDRSHKILGLDFLVPDDVPDDKIEEWGRAKVERLLLLRK